MRSDIPVAMQAAFESGAFKAQSVIAIHYSNPIYLTDSHHAITLGSNTYLPSKGKMKIPNLESTMEDKKGTISFSLPNTDRAFDAITNSEGYTDKWVSIGEVYWDSDKNLLGFLELWAGKTTKVTANETEAKFSAASYHSILEIVNAIRTTEESHARMFGTSGKGDDRTFWYAPTARQFKVGG